VNNFLLANKPTSALVAMTSLHLSLQENRPDFVPSYFLDLESPIAEAYQGYQKRVLKVTNRQESKLD